MEKDVTDFSLSLFLWQTFLVLFSIFTIYVLYKFGKVLYNYFKEQQLKLVDMRYSFEAEIGGFLWWLIIKFCKTKLEDELKEENWARNILFLIVIGLIIAFFVIKFIS